jgi:hypothetical protein
VRPEQDGLALGRGLEHVLPAVRHEAAADEHEVGERIDALELADRVDEQRQRSSTRSPRAARSALRAGSPGRELRARSPRASGCAARARAARPGTRAPRARVRADSSGLVRRARDEHLAGPARRTKRASSPPASTGPSRRPSNLTLPVTHTRAGSMPSMPKRRAYSSLCTQKSEMRLNSGSQRRNTR